jgi:DNA helicase IV
MSNKLPDISKEQNNIIQQLLNNNVVVDSVAGSGKTTCNLHIAKYFYNINILSLTYNSKLKLETREKAKKLGIYNIEVHSYHSFCVKYYDKQCFTDTIINNIIKTKKKPVKQFNFDLIVPDEAQDMTSLYYELICKIYRDNNNTNTKMCIFGDKNQSIFDFNKADQRFIEYASKLFNFNSYNWVRCNLSVSFRVTFEMSLFINRCLLKEERIISNKITNNKPRYIICDCFGGITSRTFEEVKYYFDLGYKPNDIFILAPSVKSIKSPVRQLENKIKREMPDVMVYVPTSDDEKLDE